jgi:DNA primase
LHNPKELIDQLQDRCAEYPDKLAYIYHLIQLDEKTKRDVLRAPLVIRAAIACIERVMCEKRYRHLLNLWEKTDDTTAPELRQYYQQQVYAEKLRIAELDQQQRQTTFTDLALIPWVGEFAEALERS